MIKSNVYRNIFKKERLKNTFVYIHENLNTLPVLMQLLSSLALVTTIFHLSPEYEKILLIFVFITALISIFDSYKYNEIVFITIFIIIASLFNPFYLVNLKSEVWTVLNFMVAFLFVYKVTLILSREQKLELNLNVIAKSIDRRLKELDSKTHQFTIAMIERYIINTHPHYLARMTEHTIEWREKELPEFIFSAIDVFNGENAIRVTGEDTYKGFHVLLIFYNKTVKCIIYLDPNATNVAIRLKKLMVRDHGYFDFTGSSLY